jgi:hypothetical protein
MSTGLEPINAKGKVNVENTAAETKKGTRTSRLSGDTMINIPSNEYKE